MLTLKQLQNDPDKLIEKLKVKNFDAEEIIQKAINMDNERKKTQVEVNGLQAEMNNVSKNIGKLFKEGKQEEANKEKERTLSLKEQIKEWEEKHDNIQQQINELLVQIPNIPHPSVPPGKEAQDNKEVESGGPVVNFDCEPKPHWDLADKYKLIDFELGNKLTGAGFPVYCGKGAELQRALISFFLDEAKNAGYTEYIPPYMVNEDSGFGTGQLPDKEGQMYHVQLDNFYLIPTAEVPVTNFYRDVILKEEELPIKNTAYTPCFRREAGSYGKDVRGLNRLHQFDKVEIVQIQHPEKSYETLKEMVKHAVSLVKKLELPYRLLILCGGDMSFTSALTYDLEVYSAAQKRWLEVSSISNFESYQANRLKLRYKDKETKKTQLLHTLNGSALALPRIVAALLENNQTKTGINIPAALQKYTSFDSIK